MLSPSAEHVTYPTTEQAPVPRESKSYWASAHQKREVFGGYTIVLMG